LEPRLAEFVKETCTWRRLILHILKDRFPQHRLTQYSPFVIEKQFFAIVLFQIFISPSLILKFLLADFNVEALRFVKWFPV
jgi:hypothetical protein